MLLPWNICNIFLVCYFAKLRHCAHFHFVSSHSRFTVSFFLFFFFFPFYYYDCSRFCSVLSYNWNENFKLPLILSFSVLPAPLAHHRNMSKYSVFKIQKIAIRSPIKHISWRKYRENELKNNFAITIFVMFWIICGIHLLKKLRATIKLYLKILIPIIMLSKDVFWSAKSIKILKKAYRLATLTICTC